MNKAKKKNIIQELEEEFVVLFFRMIQSIRLYQSNSQLLQDYLSGFGKVLEKLIGNEDFTFLVVNNLLCVHGETLRYRRENTRIFNGIVTSFEQRELEGLIFHPEIKEVSPEEILAFMRVLVNAESEENPCKWLEEAKKNNQFNWVDLIPSKEKRKKKGEVRYQGKGSNNLLAGKCRSQGGIPKNCFKEYGWGTENETGYA